MGGGLMKGERFTSFDVIRIAAAQRIARRAPRLAIAITPSRLAWLEPNDEPASSDAAFLARLLGVEWRAER